MKKPKTEIGIVFDGKREMILKITAPKQFSDSFTYSTTKQHQSFYFEVPQKQRHHFLDYLINLGFEAKKLKGLK